LDTHYNIALPGARFSLLAHDSILLASALAQGKWEPHLFSIFRQYLSSQNNYIDLGAFIGTTVLYGAQLARHCYAVEPNPLSYQYLLKNVALNDALRGKVTTYKGCIWNATGRCRLTAPVKPHGSASSIRHKTGPASWDVEAITFKRFLDRFHVTDVNFIKMDIEGAEAMVLPTMKDYLQQERPTILVSVHAFDYEDPLKETAAVIDSLSHYRFLYRRDGKLLDVEEVLAGRGLDTHISDNSDILATDVAWNAARR
jgi:FkbM family methyltransferase